MIRRFCKYNLVQIAAYSIDLGSFIVLTRLLLLGPIASNIVGKLLVGGLAFFMHRRFTFQSHAPKFLSEVVRYFLLLALNTPLSSFALYGFGYILPLLWAKIVGDAVCVVVTFLLVQTVVFHPARPRLERADIR